MKVLKLSLLSAALSLSLPLANANDMFGVWLDGVTSAQPGDGILNSLDHAFGAGHYTLLSDVALEGSLSAYTTIIMSRYRANFGNTSISAAAAVNLKSYVGAYGDPTQGGVALFTNDAKDNFFGATSGDPFDANLDKLFVNAATFASATGHGFIGEFNGAVLGINTLNLLPGVAGALHGTSAFGYEAGPIGLGHPIDNGVTLPFNDGDRSPFLTTITGADQGTIVDVYSTEPLLADGTKAPAILANARLIGGGEIGGNNNVPDSGGTSLMLGTGLIALFGARMRSKK